MNLDIDEIWSKLSTEEKDEMKDLCYEEFKDEYKNRLIENEEVIER